MIKKQQLKEVIMRKELKILVLMVILTVFTTLSAGAKDDPKKIIETANLKRKIAGTEQVSTLTIIDSKGRKRVRKVASVTKLFDKGTTEKVLIRFLSPADVKGTGMLTIDYDKKDDDMWLYMPALRKTRRIVSSEKSKNFMGSEFSYADMTPPEINDFNYKLVGEEKLGNEICWIIEIKPKNDDVADENGFSKKIAYFAKKDYIIRKALYYDLDGSLHKELTMKEIKEVDTKNHKYRPTHMIMVNKQNKRKSIMKINKIIFNDKVKDDFFTTRYLERK